MENKNTVVGYDYTEVTVKRGKETLYLDNYPNFGWELESTDFSLTEIDSVVLKFKRGRKIQNKTELTRLQRQFESGVKEISRLERSKTLLAVIIAGIIGAVGVGFIAGAVLFQVLAQFLAMTIVFGVIGLAVCFLGYAAYAMISKKKSQSVDQVIESQYDEIYDLCEQASKLLA